MKKKRSLDWTLNPAAGAGPLRALKSRGARRKLVGLAAGLLLGLGAGRASAQIYAQDDAAGYTTGAGNSAWLSGSNTNGGFGFEPWVFQRGGPGYQGFYVGNNTNGASYVSTNGNYWGMYANTGDGNAAVAFRAFTNALQPGTVFKIKWRNNGVSVSNPNAFAGFCLRNGDADASTNDYNNGFRLQFYYLGNSEDSFLVWDGGGVYLTEVPFGSNPLQVEITLLTADTYRLVIKNASGATTLAEFDNQPLNGSGPIDSLSLFAFDTDGDQIFNNLEIESTSLVPPDIGSLSPTNGQIFASADTPFSFEVASPFSVLSSNDVRLVLNGVDESRQLSFAGSGTSNLQVTLNTPLQANAAYTGTIIAADANGNRATNHFSFNTWLTSPDNIYVEAEDYNYGGGLWLDNLANPQPNQAYGQYDLLGSNTVDYLEYDPTGTNPPNAYRTGDLPQIEAATDTDHDNFSINGFQDYDLGYIQNGEWEDYTRNFSNVTYAVYARMAGFGGNPVMLMERAAAPAVASTNQPRAALGTFVCPQTGGPQDWTFVPLRDFFSRPVLVNFPGTNTFRLTDIGSDGSYNVNYLIFVATTNTDTLRPYLASGFPYPGAGGVGPDQVISFTIADRQTSVSNVELFLNGDDVSGTVALSNNAAGTLVSYRPPALLPAGTNTVRVICGDGAVSRTNSWQFTVASLPVIPPSDARPLNAHYSLGFAEQIAKAPDDATNVDFPATLARALAQLAGTLTNSQTGLPYANLAAGPNGDGSYTETNTINYDITGHPTGSWTFGTKSNFPYVPAGGTNNYIALRADMYLQLTPGVHTFAVRSDDGFELTAGASPSDTNLVLGIFDAGRGNGTPSTFSFIVQTNGLYPMRLVYDQGEFGGNIEFYSVNRTNGTPTLINDPASPDAVPAYYLAATPVTLGIRLSGANVVLTWNNPAYGLQAAPQVTGVYTNVLEAASPYTAPITGPQQFFRLAPR